MDFSFWVAIAVVVFFALNEGRKPKKQPPRGQGGEPLPKRPLPPQSRQSGPGRPRVGLPPRKYPVPQPAGQQGGGLGFEVPHIEGAPPQAPRPPLEIQGPDGAWHEEGSLLQEQMEALEEVRRERQQDLEREARERALRAEEEAVYEAQAKLAGNTARHPAPGLTPEQALSAVAWAEILGKPKALQRKNDSYR